MTRDIHLEKLYRYLLAGNKFGPAMRKVGVWSRSYSETPHRLKSSKKYNRFMNRKLQNIDAELERILDAMGDSDLTEEKHHELVQSYEKLTKVKLLLEGKPTEITELTARQLSDAELDAEIAKLEGDGQTERPENLAPTGEAEAGKSEARLN